MMAGHGAADANCIHNLPRGPISAALSRHLPFLLSAWRDTFGSAGGTAGTADRLRPPEIDSAGRALLRLQRGLTGERELAGAGYMGSPDLLGAYLLYYWPVSYLQVSLALAALGERGDVRGARHGVPRRILDLGSGPGPSAAAFLDAGWTDLVLADTSERALGLARRVLGATHPKANVTTAALDLERIVDEAGRGIEAAKGPFDAVVACHSLNELWKGRPAAVGRRLELVKKCAGLLAPGGFVLLVEPSLLATSRELLALRDALAADGFAILGPCLGQGPCPALAAGPGHTCHTEASWRVPEPVASLAAQAGLDRASVKMTWFAAGRPEDGRGGPARTAAFADSAAPGRSAIVVSEPMLNKAGRVRYLLCGEEGRYAFSARKDDPAARAQGFFDLKRGDEVRIVGAERRGSPGEAESLGFAAGTELRVVRPAPRI
jgi:SAM-dependent methyltransferase